MRKSYAVLAELQPARYGKTVEAEAFIAELVPPAVAAATAAGRRLARAAGTYARARRVRAAGRGRSSAPATAPVIAPATTQQFAEAVQKLEAGDFAGARPMLENLVAAEPALAAPAVNLGMLHARESRWLEAEASLQEGIRRDSANAVALNELAAVQRESGRFADAEASYRQALAADPVHYRSHRNFAVLLDLYLWRPAEALQQFESYLSKSGDRGPPGLRLDRGAQAARRRRRPDRGGAAVKIDLKLFAILGLLALAARAQDAQRPRRRPLPRPRRSPPSSWTTRRRRRPWTTSNSIPPRSRATASCPRSW